MERTPGSPTRFGDGMHGGRGDGRLRRARRSWAVASIVTFILGLTFTQAAFDAEWRAIEDREAAAIASSARDTAGAFRLELQRQNDFLADTAAFVRTDPDVTTAQLGGWVTATGAAERHPELVGLGFVRSVVREDIDEHVARVADDPAFEGSLPPDGILSVQPSSDRPFVCLLQATGLRAAGTATIEPSDDLCADPQLGSTVGQVIATGEPVYLSGSLFAGGHRLLVVTPVFEGVKLPTTEAGREEAFVGSVAAIVDADALVGRIASQRGDIAVSLRYREGATDVSFTHGDRAGATEPEWVEPLAPGWQLEVHAVGSSASGWTPTAVILLAAGIGAPMLLAGLLYVLGTSRARALDLVDAATQDLRHASLHDPLTGLANRRLLGERADALLARARRDGSRPAALFIDLDGFKSVNDTYGHAAGDEVLRAVAARLRTAVRSSDTIGRLGGDEFVVLLDGVGSTECPELVASRLVELLHRPVPIAGGGPMAVVSASIGIATGLRDAGDDLIREADVAAYRAKAAGKNRWMGADVNGEASSSAR